MCEFIKAAVDSCFSMEYKAIPGVRLEAACIRETENRYLLRITGNLEKEIPVGDWHMRITPGFDPDFFYTPHLTPTDKHVIDMHVFRTPAMMMGRGDTILCVMPVTYNFPDGINRYYLDFEAEKKRMTLGITTTQVAEHVLYHRTDKAVLPAGEFVFEARVMIITGEACKNPFREVLSYAWEKYGRKDSEKLPACRDLMPYVEHTYAWALDRWKDVVWQEFDLNGVRVGAPQMIVIAQQSPNHPEEVSIREDVAIWNQAWFSSLRSAQGVYRYGKAAGNDEYVKKALMTKELALQFPQEDGLFDTVIGCPSEIFDVDGKKIRRSLGWDHKFFGNSDRNPYAELLKDSPRHVLDMSWTCLKMLEWYEELEKDSRLVEYAETYARRLLSLQDERGYFPAWIDRITGEILPVLSDSPECAVSVSLLIKLYNMTGEKAYLDSAIRCMNALIDDVMPDSRWEDFETYWSCSRYGSQDMVGKKYPRNVSYKQNSLSPFWMAQALYECHAVTGDARYIEKGERCLDEMLMYQSSCQPSYIPITVVGGFGVMNGDSELNDARQSLFAETIINYGCLLNRDEYIQRGVSALRASFSMMYCPENPFAREQWEKRWPHFNEKDYGFMMENYGHSGYVNGQDLGLGVFTIYDWGNGAASEAVMRIKAHHPDLFE